MRLAEKLDWKGLKVEIKIVFWWPWEETYIGIYVQHIREFKCIGKKYVVHKNNALRFILRSLFENPSTQVVTYM
jgi:hypothetical protein